MLFKSYLTLNYNCSNKKKVVRQLAHFDEKNSASRASKTYILLVLALRQICISRKFRFFKRKNSFKLQKSYYFTGINFGKFTGNSSTWEISLRKNVSFKYYKREIFVPSLIKLPLFHLSFKVKRWLKYPRLKLFLLKGI